MSDPGSSEFLQEYSRKRQSFALGSRLALQKFPTHVKEQFFNFPLYKFKS